MDTHDRLIRVFSGTDILCHALEDNLEEIGVEGMIKNVFQSSISTGFFSGSPSTIDLYIAEADLEKAKALIEEFIKRNSE